MRILFISDILLTGDLAYRLSKEGHDVRLFIGERTSKRCFETLVTRTRSWKRSLSWVGKDGLIVFDDVGWGAEQDALRKKGYTVFGGSEDAERLEVDRHYGYKIFKQHGLKTVPLISFHSTDLAIDYIKKHPGKWAIKYENGHWLKPYAFIGDHEDGSDAIVTLENYARFRINDKEIVTLQQKIEGVEIGVARYFNGTQWVGPIEYNVEHTHLFPGDYGPTVDEMGTLAWYSEDENERLYREVLEPLAPFLAKVDFRGNFDINCIVNEKGAFPIEATSRLGAPIIHLQKEMFQCAWGELLYGVARGENISIPTKSGMGVVVSVAIPPFPYRDKNIGKALHGTSIYFRKQPTDEMLKHVHFDEVASHDGTLNQLYIAGQNGYAFYATGEGKTIREAQRKAYTALQNVYVSRMFYRDDIGTKFAKESVHFMRTLGYLSSLNNSI